MIKETLPDCMMPDGAQPCIGFTQLESKTRAIAAIAADVRLIPTAKLAAIVLALHGGWLTRKEIAKQCGVHDMTIRRALPSLAVDESERMTVHGPHKIYRWKGDNT